MLNHNVHKYIYTLQINTHTPNTHCWHTWMQVHCKKIERMNTHTHIQDKRTPFFGWFLYPYEVRDYTLPPTHTHTHCAESCTVYHKHTSVPNSFTHIKHLRRRQTRQLQKKDASNGLKHTHTLTNTHMHRQTEGKLHTRCGRIWHILPRDGEGKGESETDGGGEAEGRRDGEVKWGDGGRTAGIKGTDTHMHADREMSKSTQRRKLHKHTCKYCGAFS